MAGRILIVGNEGITALYWFATELPRKLRRLDGDQTLHLIYLHGWCAGGAGLPAASGFGDPSTRCPRYHRR